MFPSLVERISEILVAESIRDEAMGDLWEIHHNSLNARRSKFLVTINFIIGFLDLIRVSVIIFFEENMINKTAKYDYSQISDNSSHKACDILSFTTDDFKRVKKYCDIRKIYDSKIALKLLGKQMDSESHWVCQADRIIRNQKRNSKLPIDSDVIINGFILSSFVRKLEEHPPGELSLADFSSLMQDVNLTPEFVERYVIENQANHQRKLICKTWYLTVYVITWLPGQESWMHHHGNELGAIKVIRGAMTHWLISPEEWQEEVPFECFYRTQKYDGQAEVINAGQSVLVDRRHGHQIANNSDEPLVTLHFRFGCPSGGHNGVPTYQADLLVWNPIERCFDLSTSTADEPTLPPMTKA